MTGTQLEVAERVYLTLDSATQKHMSLLYAQ